MLEASKWHSSRSARVETMNSLVLAGVVLSGTMSVAACGCRPVLATQVLPGRDVTLRPGDALTIEYAEGGACGESPSHPAVRFTSSDSLVARVDSLTGRLSAMRAGEASVWLNYAGLPRTATSHTAEVLVHVR